MPRRRSSIRGGRLLDVESGRRSSSGPLLIRGRPRRGDPGPDDGVPDGARRARPRRPDRPARPHRHPQPPHRRRPDRRRAGDDDLAPPRTRCSASATRARRSRRGSRRVRDLGTFRAFVDVALRDAIDAGGVEGPRMQCAGAYITSPWGGGDVVGLAHDIPLPEDLRFGVVDVAGRGPRAGPAAARSAAPTSSSDRHRRGPHPRRRARRARAVRGRGPGGGRGGRATRRRSSPPTRTAPRASSGAIRAGARSVEHGSMHRRRGDRDARRHAAHSASVDLYDGEWALEEGEAGAVAGRDDGEDRGRRLETGIEVIAQGRRARASASPTGPTAGCTRTSSSRGSSRWYVRYGMTPLAAIRSRDGRRGGVPGLVGPRRAAGAGAVRRPRGRRRRSARGRRACSSGRRSS